MGDALNSSTIESTPAEIGIVTRKRPGPYLIRRGHFTLIDDDAGALVPQAHQLAWKQLTDEKIIFLVRDPRAICVSGAYHWQVSNEVFLERMIRGDVAGCGRWDEYCEKWYYLGNRRMTIMTYERLLDYPQFWIQRALRRIDVQYEDNRLIQAIKRQSFATRKAEIGDNEAELRRQNIHTGIVGNWRNYFTPAMNEQIWNEFGWMMEKLGYNDKLG